MKLNKIEKNDEKSIEIGCICSFSQWVGLFSFFQAVSLPSKMKPWRLGVSPQKGSTTSTSNHHSTHSGPARVHATHHGPAPPRSGPHLAARPGAVTGFAEARSSPGLMRRAGGWGASRMEAENKCIRRHLYRTRPF